MLILEISLTAVFSVIIESLYAHSFVWGTIITLAFGKILAAATPKKIRTAIPPDHRKKFLVSPGNDNFENNFFKKNGFEGFFSISSSGGKNSSSGSLLYRFAAFSPICSFE